MSWTFTTSAKAIKRAGENADATITADTTTLGNWSDMIEGHICNITETDFLTDYNDLEDLTKYQLDNMAAALIAMLIITWNPNAYRNVELDSLLNLNDGIVDAGLSALKNTKGVKLKSPT